MPDLSPVPLTPVPVLPAGAEFAEIAGWQFADSYVSRLLRDDIPQRRQFGFASIWTYRNPDGQIVGFGTLDVCGDYRDYTGGRLHSYIPLLAVNPSIKSLGYGTSIVKHLMAEAVSYTFIPNWCSDLLFLDVYVDNARAISLYERCGFRKLSDEPMRDRQENDRPYFVMARRISVVTP